DNARVPFAALQDAQLHYQEHGVGDPLVLVHGFTGAGEMWANVVPAFADRYRVVVPDLRGHGRSTGAPETIRHQQLGADLVALLARFRGVDAGLDALPFTPADLAAIARPVLVLHGDRDPFFPIRVATTMYEAMPNAELAVLPAVAHGPPWERTDLFVRILAD